MNQPYLRMKGIGKEFPGVKALSGVTFDAYTGEAIALLGANGAGKSTLMNVLGGVIQPDEGSIEIGGSGISIKSPLEASAHGIAFVHQEMALLPTMTVMDNLFISRYPLNGGIVINRKEIRAQSTKVLEKLGCRISPEHYIRDLGTGDRQMVEIGRALLGRNKIFIFDEPTSSLTKKEKDNLVKVIQNLKDQGYLVIYITHFLNEVYEICERVCVLRGGEVVGGGLSSEVSMDQLVTMMVGDVTIEDRGSERGGTQSPEILEIKDLNRAGVLRNIRFSLHKGEILGLWGLLGSGRTEVVRSLIGLDKVDTIDIRINTGSGMEKLTPAMARKFIGIVTEERRGDGLFLSMSVNRNMSMANLKRMSRNGLRVVDQKLEAQLCDEFVDRLNIQISDKEQTVATLSGGNQQKVIFGRWLEVSPPILILDEPTRGLDVSAKAEIARIIVKLAEEGTSIILISSEIEEMMSLCDRYLVMNKGRIIGELGFEATHEELIGLAAGATTGTREI